MVTQLVKCTCTHESQDNLHGKGNRMANTMRTGQLKCTVCGTIHGVSSLASTTKAKAKETTPEPAKKAPVTRTNEKKNAKSPEKKKSMKGGKR